jgi:hypothetical protein
MLRQSFGVVDAHEELAETNGDPEHAARCVGSRLMVRMRSPEPFEPSAAERQRTRLGSRCRSSSLRHEDPATSSNGRAAPPSDSEEAGSTRSDILSKTRSPRRKCSGYFLKDHTR